MKTTISTYRSMIATLVLALAVSSAAMANDENKKGSALPGVEFKYVGKVGNNPAFVLNLTNENQEEYIIRFRDAQGTVLYMNSVKSNLTQRFIIDTEQVESNTLFVEVTSRKSKKREVFTIKRNQTVVDETVVAKND